MKSYSEYLIEMRNTRSTVPFRQETDAGEVFEKLWPDPIEWEVINFGAGGDRFGNQATVTYQNQETGHTVEINAMDIERGGSKGKWELYGNGVTKTGTFKKFEDIDGLLKKTLPALSKKIWASIDKQIPKKIGNFTRSVLPYDLDVSYEGMDKSDNYTSIVFEELQNVVEGGTGTYILQSGQDDVRYEEGTWKSFKDMISIVKGL